MLIANDKYGNRVSIENALSKGEYFCPVCGSPLIVKNKGKKKHPHYAHRNLVECDWGDMSEWHIAWQERFPEECREVVLENNGEKHRADILLKEYNTVIEIQHSPISKEEFNIRNKFYTDCGFELIWIFDADNKIRPEEWENSTIETLSFSYENLENDLKWNRKCTTFEGFHELNTGRGIMILLETKTSGSGRAILTNVKKITEKYISAYSYCEKVYIENFLKMFGIVTDDDIRSMKDIAEESATRNRQYLMRREQELQSLLRMGGVYKPKFGKQMRHRRSF